MILTTHRTRRRFLCLFNAIVLIIGFLIALAATPQVVFAQYDEGQSPDEGPSEAERLLRLEGIVELDC